jgi:hypothetical protein
LHRVEPRSLLAGRSKIGLLDSVAQRVDGVASVAGTCHIAVISRFSGLENLSYDPFNGLQQKT